MSTSQHDGNEGEEHVKSRACNDTEEELLGGEYEEVTKSTPIPSSGKDGVEYVSSQACKASRAEWRQERYYLLADCPACWKAHKVKCLIADHR